MPFTPRPPPPGAQSGESTFLSSDLDLDHKERRNEGRTKKEDGEESVLGAEKKLLSSTFAAEENSEGVIACLSEEEGKKGKSS